MSLLFIVVLSHLGSHTCKILIAKVPKVLKIRSSITHNLAPHFKMSQIFTSPPSSFIETQNKTTYNMGCKINTSNTPFLCQFTTKKPNLKTKTISFSSLSPNQTTNQQEPISSSAATQPQSPKTDSYNVVKFKTLGDCKLGISRYPDFVYNAEGGTGTGTCAKIKGDDVLLVDFDLKTLYIPPLTSATTRFLGLPLPPFLKIDIVPQQFQGSIDQDSGKIDLEFMAKFLFSIGTIYRAPPLLVKTVLTSEESTGTVRSGIGERLGKEGKCKLVGVATVDPIDDFFMNSFLGLPTECLAILNATISFSNSP